MRTEWDFKSAQLVPVRGEVSLDLKFVQVLGLEICSSPAYTGTHLQLACEYFTGFQGSSRGRNQRIWLAGYLVNN
jgi:hypothetical protein